MDYNSFKKDDTYFETIKQDELAEMNCNILISGTCTAINNDETEPDWNGCCLTISINENTEIFTCPRSAYYVIRCEKFELPWHYNACKYYLDMTEK